MLAIRVKYNDGLEDLFEAESSQAVAPHYQGQFGQMVIDFFRDGKVYRRIDSGVVYVMSQGKTVAKYDLRQLPAPAAVAA